MSNNPLNLDPFDADMIAALRAQTEVWRRNMRMFDSLPIEEQERIMLEIKKREIADLVQAKEARRSGVEK